MLSEFSVNGLLSCMLPGDFPCDMGYRETSYKPRKNTNVLLRSAAVLIGSAFIGIVVVWEWNAADAAAPDSRGERPIQFVDCSAATGLTFQHESPFTEERHIHLTMGSGVAWIDADRNGEPDLFLGQGRAWWGSASNTTGDAPISRLFRNREGHFDDISVECGIINADYAMGLAVGDYDNDGFADLYVTNFGTNHLFHNQGDGTFLERPTAGVRCRGYSSSCTWTDVDADGAIDLYVTNYVQIDPTHYGVCTQTFQGKEIAIPCAPWRYPALPDVLYRNRGDGTFEDISQAAGFDAIKPGRGLGVLTADLDDDGDLDFYVANDTTDNFLLLNDGRGRFLDHGPASGTATNRFGQAGAGMGVAAGDVDGDGRLDLMVTNFYGEMSTLYRNEGDGLFLDVTNEFGIAAASRTRLGFGLLMEDFDSDSDLDVFVANGHLNDRLAALGMNVPYQQRSQLLSNQQRKRFVDRSSVAGPYFQHEGLGRGCAAADFDGDGRLDIVVQHLQGPAVLLRNTTSTENQSLRLELVGTQGNRDGIGARVEVTTAGRTIVRHRGGSSSYLSCNAAPLVIGIGTATVAETVRVCWLNGKTEDWENLPAGVPLVLREGTGTISTP